MTFRELPNTTERIVLRVWHFTGVLEPHHKLDLSWYAIHPIELLYSLLGPGCEEVSRTFTPDADVLVGRWNDGRIGTVRALRPYSDYGAVVFRPKQIVESPSRPS